MNPIQVNYEYTNNLYKANQWLTELPNIFAADFEVASKFTKKEKQLLNYRIANTNPDAEQKRIWLQCLNSNGLSYPGLSVITHLSVAWSKQDAKVIVCNNETIRKFVYKFLTTVPKLQLWHNCQFDFKHIYFHTKLLPKYYEDTMLLAKSLINDADPFKCRVNLKELMATDYGAWAISKDSFTLEEMWEETTIKYSAIDAASTYKLYQDIQESLSRS